MNTEQERAEFEAWANGRCELHLVNPAGRYSSATTQFAWESYQAGRAALQSQDREDAERYRWLCDKFGITKLPCALERIIAGDVYVADGKAGIDEAIDHARRVAAQVQAVVNQQMTTESDREAMADEFEAWWINVGQYLPACRGANYKKTFAYRAYEHAYDVGFRAALAQQPSGQALEDAERYRWLRNENADISRTHTLTVVIDTPNGGTWVGSDLDAAIDAARAAKERA